MVEIPGTLRVVKEDSEDDKFLETAEVAGAKFIVSGDRDLLALAKYTGITIIGARAFLDLVSGTPETIEG